MLPQFAARLRSMQYKGSPTEVLKKASAYFIGDKLMDLAAEMERLRQHLDDLAQVDDDAFTTRYTLRRPPLPPGVYWQLRALAGRTLRRMEQMGILRPDPWPASLKHSPARARAKPFLIWAVGTERDTLREACSGFAEVQDSVPGFAPVLVTDVADFAFFSRLGWLVEYVPQLPGGGEPYENRKIRLLARLYPVAPVVPASAGMRSGSGAEELRQCLFNSG